MYSIKNFSFAILCFTIFSRCIFASDIELDQTLDYSSSELLSQTIGLYPEGTQFAIAIVEGGNTEYLGLKKNSDSIIEVNNQDFLFEIGSITKVFTSLLLAEGIHSGRYDEQTTLSEIYGGNLIDAYKDLRLTELSNHTSGMPRVPNDLSVYLSDMSDPYKDYSYKVLSEYLLRKDPIFNTEKKYAYSNLGPSVLALALQNDYNRPYGRLLDSLIFNPLGMQETTIDVSETGDNLVRGLNQVGATTSNWDMAGMEGAGAILSNVSDMSKFIRMQFATDTTSFYSLAMKETFKVNDNLSLGMGWHISKNSAGQKMHWHNGGTGGYSSMLLIDNESKKGIILLSNVSAFHPKRQEIDNTVFELMKAVSE